MLRTFFSRALALLALTLAACGGGEPAAPAPQPRQFAAPPPLDATTLLDWAETQYPQYFPVHATNRSATVGPDVYTYRAYQVNGTTNLVGVTADGRIDVLLPDATGTAPFTVGTLTAFTCRVLPQNCLTSVSGTAAAGGALAGVVVTLKDSAGNTVTATTAPSGSYTLNTTGLSGPFLLQATAPGGASLYGVTADLATATVANLTPLTDLIVRSWYSLHNVPVDTAFASPVAHPAPTVQQASAVADTVLSVMQLALNSSNAGIAAPLELIEKPFVADHTGLDAVLDATSIVYGTGATLTLSAGTTHQTSTITYDAGSGTITTASTTASATNTSNSVVSAVIPLQTAQSDALNAITALMNNLASVVNSRGASLTSADLAPILDPGLINDGLNRDQFAADMVAGLSQVQSVAIAVKAIKSLDLVNGRAEVELLATQTAAGQTSTDDTSFVFHQVNGAWMLAGNDRAAKISLFAEARTDQGALANSSYQAINVDVRAPQNTISSARVVSGASSLSLSHGPTAVDDSGLLLDSFLGNTGPLPPGSLPAAGSIYSVIMSRTSGNVTYGVPLNAFTSEPVPFTSPTGSSLADANLGGTLNVSWNLPVTYAVRAIQLAALVFTDSQSSQGTFQCESPQVVTAANATSGAISVPAICNGKPVVSVNVNLTVTGVNGERSQTIYMMK